MDVESTSNPKNTQLEIERTVQELDMRVQVISYSRPDILALAETWLKWDEVINIQGYKFFGHNRKQLN